MRPIIASFVLLFGVPVLLVPVACSSAPEAPEADVADEPLEDEFVSKALIGTFEQATRTPGTLRSLMLLEKDAQGARRFTAAYSKPGNSEHYYRGTYTFWRKTIRLTVDGSTSTNPAPFERFAYQFDAAASRLVLTPMNGGTSSTLARGAKAFCDDESECSLQRLSKPGCVGEWSCESSTCEFVCQSQCVAQGGECMNSHVLSEEPDLCSRHSETLGCGVDDTCCFSD
jgi:hypothetical protein